MRTGFRCGNRRRRGRCGAGILPPPGKRVGMDLFIEDGAYTTVASACAMLVVLSLLFSSSLAIWSASRAGDVQVGADATALAGENVVSSYHTAATVLDACALSLGLAGFTMTGAGMVGLFVPGGQGLARETLDAAMRVFDMRDSFISSASSGLKRVEGSLPFLIAANAARACDAQGSESVGYRGTAFAVPTTSASEFPAMEGRGSTQRAWSRRAAASRKRQPSSSGSRRRLRQGRKRRGWRIAVLLDETCRSARGAFQGCRLLRIPISLRASRGIPSVR